MSDSLIPKKPVCLLWSEIKNWTYGESLLRFSKLPDGWQLLPVNEFAKQIDEREIVSPETEYRMVGVRLYGEGAFHRETVLGKEQSARHLYPLKPGRLIYNRLFAWRGSFAVVPEELNNYYVSNEFPQFRINQAIALPKYIYLLFTTKKLINAVDKTSVGSSAVSRNRFNESEFSKFKVPIPPIPVQRKIVAYWEDAQQDVLSAQESLEGLIEELHVYLCKRTNGFELVTHSKMFMAHFAQIQQWDVKAGRAAAFMAANPDFIRLGDFTKECTETVKPWEEPDKKWPIYGVNNKEGVFLSSTQLGREFNAPYKKIQRGWFFHNPTRANVGSLGIVPEVPGDAITSPEYQVWRLSGEFIPDFMALLLKTNYFLELVAFNRVGGVKQRMYYANLAEIRLPKIPENVQNDFVNRYRKAMERISAASSTLARKKMEIDQMVLGTRPIEET
jgi:type I restriction enzyme S subunit